MIDSVWVGGLLTLLPWGLLADRVGERLVLAAGLGGCAAALVGAAHAGRFAALLLLLAIAGAAGASVNAASGRAVMYWFPAAERGFALGRAPDGDPGRRLLSRPRAARARAESAACCCSPPGSGGAVFGAVGDPRSGGSRGRAPAAADRRDAARRAPLAALHRAAASTSSPSSRMTGFVVLFLYDERGFSHGEAALVLAGDPGARRGVPDRRRALVGPGRLARGAAAAGRAREQRDARRRRRAPWRTGRRARGSTRARGRRSRWPGTGSRSRPRPRSRAGRGAAPRSGCSRRRLRRPAPSCRRSSRLWWPRRRGGPGSGSPRSFPLAGVYLLRRLSV